MALKTQPHKGSVEDFLRTVDPARRPDCEVLLEMMEDLTGEKPVLWGPSIIGFGTYHYVYESGTEGDWFLTGFSPRKKNLSIYVMDGFKKHAALLEKLGKHSHSVSCLYVKKLDDIDLDVLRSLIEASLCQIREKYC